MNLRRVLPLGLGVTALLVVAGIASRGRPLGKSRSQGPTANFFDYVYTTLVVAGLLAFVITAYVLATNLRARKFQAPPGRFRLLSSFLAVAGALALAYFLRHSHFLAHIQHLPAQPAANAHGLHPKAIPPGTHGRGAHVQWNEILVIAALLFGTAALLYSRRRKVFRAFPRAIDAQAALAFALDESLDDLRNDPDLRRAIIAAYARMERTLAAYRLPRQPSEAPFEYLERILVLLTAREAPVRRLTTLFEWAKFSAHEPDAAMRDEAVDALVAVRDELRPPAAAA